MKATGIITLGLLIVISFGLLWAFANNGNSTSSPQDQQVTGNEKHDIDLVTALRFIKNYRENPKAPSVKGGFFARNAFEKILAQPGTIGIRYYYAQNDANESTLVLVGVGAQGQDIQTGVIAEVSRPCPPFCGKESELSK